MNINHIHLSRIKHNNSASHVANWKPLNLMSCTVDDINATTIWKSRYIEYNKANSCFCLTVRSTHDVNFNKNNIINSLHENNFTETLESGG